MIGCHVWNWSRYFVVCVSSSAKNEKREKPSVNMLLKNKSETKLGTHTHAVSSAAISRPQCVRLLVWVGGYLLATTQSLTHTVSDQRKYNFFRHTHGVHSCATTSASGPIDRCMGARLFLNLHTHYPKIDSFLDSWENTQAHNEESTWKKEGGGGGRGGENFVSIWLINPFPLPCFLIRRQRRTARFQVCRCSNFVRIWEKQV